MGICASIPHAIVHLLLREASNSRYRGSKQAKQVLVLHSSLLLSFPLLSYPIAKLCSFLPLSHIQSQSKQLFGLSALQRPTGSPTGTYRLLKARAAPFGSLMADRGPIGFLLADRLSNLELLFYGIYLYMFLLK